MIAVLLSDIHFSHSPPVARSVEENWYDVMFRQWKEVDDLWDGECPIIIAGDIFDHWSRGVTPELISFAIQVFKGVFNGNVYAIPGQHDLPNHRYEERKRSAYWTLVEADAIRDMASPTNVGADLMAHPFWWGKEIHPCSDGYEDFFNLAVCHSYVWTNSCSYQGADVNQKAPKYRNVLKGYDAAVFGDNHKGFLCKYADGLRLFNCGTFYRRKIDETDYRPMVGLLMPNGEIEICPLDVSKDKFFHESVAKNELPSGFVQGLKKLDVDSLDFRSEIHKAVENEDSGVRDVVLEAVD